MKLYSKWHGAITEFLVSSFLIRKVSECARKRNHSEYKKEWSRGGGWRFAAAFYRAAFLRAVEREKEKDQEIAKLKGEISQLKHQLFGRKSESRNGSEKTDASKSDEEQKDGSQKAQPEKRKRGGQPGHQGQPRKERSQLPVCTETLALTEAEKHCQQCGQPYAPFPPRQSSRIEYEIKIFVQQYEHERACRGCQCQQSPGIVEASAPSLVWGNAIDAGNGAR